MKNTIYLYSFFLCLIFFIANLKKVGLKGKSSLLPSTIFSAMWAVTSLGAFLFSNGLAFENIYSVYYLTAGNLETIGEYQLLIMISIFSAFLLARFNNRGRIFHTREFDESDVLFCLKKFRWILNAYFIVGLFRLILVLSMVGFNYAAIRSNYITGRASFSLADVWLIRIGSYLMQAAVFYIAMLGIKSALRGIDLKEIIKTFILFVPFQMSFGGRLFILSFFEPFIFSYLLVVITTSIKISSAEKRKITTMAISAVSMVIVLAVLKQGEVLSMASIAEYSSDIFYTVASYHYMNEFWDALPNGFSIEWGRNICGMGSPIAANVHAGWIDANNNAIMTTPSMIPDVYLDFGRYGSLLFFFTLFYKMEINAIRLLQFPSIRNILVVLLMLVFCFSTSTSSMSDSIKSFVIGYVLIYFMNRTIKGYRT